MSALKLAAGILIIVIQVFIGARAFFPDAFATTEDEVLNDLVENKKSIADKIDPADLMWLSKNNNIKAGVDPNFYPLEMFDERGRYTGLGGDYMRLLEKMTGLHFQPINQPNWEDTEKMAQKGELDIFMAAAKTGRRSEYMLFTAPYITLPGVLMTKRGSGLGQLDINNLAGKRVAVVQDYAWHDFLKEFHPEITPIPAPTTLEALRKVTEGEADAILDYEFNLLEKIQTAGILQMQIAGNVDSNYGHAIAVRKDKPELFNIISVALAQIQPKEQKLLADKWLEKEKPADQEKRLQWIFFFFMQATLLCLGLYWYMNHSVTTEVKKRLSCILAANQTKHSS